MISNRFHGRPLSKDRYPLDRIDKIFLSLGSLLILCLMMVGRPLRAEAEDRSPVARLIQAQIEARQDDRQFTCQGELICGIALIPDFYAARNFEPAWSTSLEPTPQARSLLEEIRRVDEDGLSPEDYHYSRLQAMAVHLAAGGPDAMTPPLQLRADFDLLMTDAAFLLGAHILGGRVNPETIHGAWSAFSHEVDLIRFLNDGLQGGRVAPMIQALHPPYTGYTGLRQALADYRRMAAAGGWPHLADGPSLRLGDESPLVARLRERLHVSGDLADMPLSLMPNVFDEPLETAVKAFQFRHGLEADGVVGKKTRQVLNVPVEQRIQQLLINMERWRWIPNNLGPRYLVVNIADFNLTMVDEGRVRGTMRVVVGRAYRKTPVFSGTMTYLEFNPFWNIPRRLAIEDILPRVQKDPGYIDQQGIRIFSGWSEDAVPLSPGEVDWASLNPNHFPIRLQQAPGPKNALGRIKFMFPNQHAVYLHDTPAKGLFNSVSRSFSSGCIRVEDPTTLAAFVLEGTEGWDRETIAKHLGDGERRVVRLQRPIPVHLLYWTAWSDANGIVFFREDIYERDAPLMRALKEKPAPQVWTPTERLPGPHWSDVDVDEIGSRIVADPTLAQTQGDFADRRRPKSRDADIGRIALHVQALTGHAAAATAQLGIGDR
jgi:murein L,D-transpeptidase YcbB/YkuD